MGKFPTINNKLQTEDVPCISPSFDFIFSLCLNSDITSSSATPSVDVAEWLLGTVVAGLGTCHNC